MTVIALIDLFFFFLLFLSCFFSLFFSWCFFFFSRWRGLKVKRKVFISTSKIILIFTKSSSSWFSSFFEERLAAAAPLVFRNGFSSGGGVLCFILAFGRSATNSFFFFSVDQTSRRSLYVRRSVTKRKFYHRINFIRLNELTTFVSTEKRDFLLKKLKKIQKKDNRIQ